MQANVTVGVRVRFGAAHGQVLTEATLVPFSTVGLVRSLYVVHPFLSSSLDVHVLLFSKQEQVALVNAQSQSHGS